MTEALREKCRQIQVLLAPSVATTSRVRRDVGAIVSEVMRSPNRYGKRGVGQLASALGRNEDTLYEWARVADAWSGEQLDAILERRTPHGVPVSISHLVRIAGIRDVPRRDAWLERAVSEGLSVKALRRLLEQELQLASSPAEDEQDENDDAAASRALAARYGERVARALRRASRYAESLDSVPEDELEEPRFLRVLSEKVAEQIELASVVTETVTRLRAKLRRLSAGSGAQKRGARKAPSGDDSEEADPTS